MRKVAYNLASFVIGASILCAALWAALFLAMQPSPAYGYTIGVVAAVLGILFFCAIIVVCFEVGDYVLRESGWRKP